MEHMNVYGENNRERMTEHETASYDKFTMMLQMR